MRRYSFYAAGAAIALCMLFVASSSTTAEDAKADRDANRDRTAAGQFDEKTKGTVIRASKIIGMNIQNPQGESVGEVNDIVLDANTGKTRYAAVTYGGFIGIGDKLFAVPWEAFTLGHEQDDPDEFLLILDVPKERLELAPGFDSEHWPATGDAFWTEVDKFYPRNDVEASTAP